MYRILVYEDQVDHFNQLRPILRETIPEAEIVWCTKMFATYSREGEKPVAIQNPMHLAFRSDSVPRVIDIHGEEKEGKGTWWPAEFSGAIFDVYEQTSGTTVGSHFVKLLERTNFQGPVVVCSQTGISPPHLLNSKVVTKTMNEPWRETAVRWLSDQMHTNVEPICGSNGRNRADAQEIKKYWDYIFRLGRRPQLRSAVWIGSEWEVRKIAQDLLYGNYQWNVLNDLDLTNWIAICKKYLDNIPNLICIDYGHNKLPNSNSLAQEVSELRQLWAEEPDVSQPLFLILGESFRGFDDSARRNLSSQGVVPIQRELFLNEPCGWVIDAAHRFSNAWAGCLSQNRKRNSGVEISTLLRLFDSYIQFLVITGSNNYAIGEWGKIDILGLVSWLAESPGSLPHFNKRTPRSLPNFLRESEGRTRLVDPEDPSKDLVNRHTFRALSGNLKNVDPSYEPAASIQKREFLEKVAFFSENGKTTEEIIEITKKSRSKVEAAIKKIQDDVR